jgi:hypothetical protein
LGKDIFKKKENDKRTLSNVDISRKTFKTQSFVGLKLFANTEKH